MIGHKINPFQPSVAFHVETSHLFSSAKQMPGFHMERSTGQKWFKGTAHFNLLMYNVPKWSDTLKKSCSNISSDFSVK